MSVVDLGLIVAVVLALAVGLWVLAGITLGVVRGNREGKR